MDGELARLSKEQKLELYRIMFTARMIEETISRSIKKNEGFVPTVALVGIGEEAVTAGAAYALDPKIDWIFPGHRSLSALIRFGLTPLEQIANYGCKAESLMGGRDGNVHHAIIARHIGKFISHMGAGAPSANGTVDGLRYLYELEGKKDDPLSVSMVFFGDGASQQGTIHEAMNYAATRNLPVIFVIDNNHISTATPTEEQYAARHLFLRAFGYNIGWEYVRNGNDVVDVYNAAARLVERARYFAKAGPHTGEVRASAILECDTFRWSGHNETNKIPDVDLYEFAQWRARDPIAIYRRFLLSLPSISDLEKIADRDPRKMRRVEAREFSEEEIIAIEQAVEKEVADAYEKAKAMRDPDPAIDGRAPVFPMPTIVVKAKRRVEPFEAGLFDTFSKEERKGFITLGQSIQGVIRETLKTNKKARVFGEDVVGKGRLKGGVYGMTLPALKDADISKEQIFDTPLSEIAILGSAVGQSLVGIMPIVEIQYLPFLSVALSQVIDYAATHYYTTRHPIRMIVRLPYGAGMAAGHYHSASILEALLYHTPGLKMVDPATPKDAAGLFRQALREEAPVMFKENIWGLSRIFGAPAPDLYRVPFGLPALRKEGKDLTIITWGAKTIFDAVLPAVSALEAEGKTIEIIELRSLAPLDIGFVIESVRRTHRALIVHEDVLTGGIGESVAAKVQKEAFGWLLAPVEIVASHDTPVPQHPNLERAFLPSSGTVLAKSRELLEYR